MKIELAGLDKIGAVDGPCVYIANHMSTLETLVLPGIVQPVKDVTFIVKRGIIEYPIFKHVMLVRDPIVVDRVNPREDLQVVMSHGAEILKSGRSLIVFPQTTRTFQFEPERFNTIGVKLARRAGVPVVPVAVKSDAWTNGRVVKEFGKIDVSKVVHLEFGDALHIQDRGAEEHRAIIDYISERLETWSALDETPGR
ncbi:MAG: 1-acyl-sn-glycerol-3-phosphate acyltransferase [Caldilineaceae bacterium]|nr:1-acyl-sn-glycerol-3-phosphate acyltransferase [Caldilineaceae bacterium]